MVWEMIWKYIHEDGSIYMSRWWFFKYFCNFNPYLVKWSNLTNHCSKGWNHQPVIYLILDVYMYIHLSNFRVYFTHIGFNCFALNLTSQQFFNELPDIVPQRWLTYIRNFTLFGSTVKSKWYVGTCLNLVTVVRNMFICFKGIFFLPSLITVN